MAKAYTPGLKVTNRIMHRVRRILPIPGEVLVEQGQKVEPETIVAETFMPGDVTPVNLTNLLSAPPGDIPELMLKRADCSNQGHLRHVQEHVQVQT